MMDVICRFMDPQPNISAFREPSFGHGQLLVVNGSHALWTWRRNEDDVAVASDQFWFTNLKYHPTCS